MARLLWRTVCRNNPLAMFPNGGYWAGVGGEWSAAAMALHSSIAVVTFTYYVHN